MGPLQFSLRALFIFLAACSVVSTSIHYLGFGPITILGIIVLACWGWALLHCAAPVATKYITVFTVMGLCLYSILVAGLLEARERSRRERCIYNALQWSRSVHAEQSFHPEKAFAYPAGAARGAGLDEMEQGEP